MGGGDIDFQTWATKQGVTPDNLNLTEWLRLHPGVTVEVKRAVDAKFSWDQAAAYAVAQGSPPCNGEALRKAVKRHG
jgi:hypothetical protein